MTSSDDADLNELLALVNHAGPLPGDTEERLLIELHSSLDRGPLESGTHGHETDVHLADTDAEILTLSSLDRPEGNSRRASRAAWVGAAAAALIALAMATVLVTRQPETRVEDQPALPPLLLETSLACERFSETTPARADLTDLVANEGPAATNELQRTIDAFEVLRRDLDAGAELAADDLMSLELALGFLSQAHLELQNGQPATPSLQQAHELMRGLGDVYPSFRVCRDY